MRALRVGVWCAAAAILSFQLFVPPIIGLSDQGDFARMIGRFGYAPEDKSSFWDAYVKRKYVRDPAFRYPKLEQPSSEYLFVGAAVLVSKLAPDGKLDIRLMGFIHMAAFLTAFWYLLRSTPPVVWLVSLLILTDVGYVAYWNSFYAEPASCIFLLLLIAETARPKVNILRWSAWAALLILAKPQNLALAPILIGFILYRLLTRAALLKPGGAERWIAAAIIIVACVFTLATIPEPLKQANTYNVVFLSILPESKTPAKNLQALGADPSLAKFSGTGAWSPGTGFDEMLKSGVIGQQLTPAKIAKFYLTHPVRIWRHTRALLPVAFSLRPEFCGNFERSSGRPPGAKSHSFAVWSWFHERVLGRAGRFVVFALILVPIFLRDRWLALLAASAIFAFLAAALGDAWDNVKHMFLFNLLVDAWLVLTLCRIARTLPGARPDPSR